MPRRIVDLSQPLEADIASDPPPILPQITYMDHQQTAEQVIGFFPGLKKEDLPGGEGWAVEMLQMTTHNGTHMDAPYHYHSTMDKGERAITIDEVPLDWCFQRGVKLDFRHFDDGYVVTAADVEAELKRIGHEIAPLDIVVINTAAGAAYGKPDYLMKGCGMGREATLYLLERGVRVTGTDAWSWDAPFPLTAQEYARTGDASIIWQGHRAGMEIGYCHMEKLGNLESVPATGYEIACFPYKVKGGSGGFVRAVAIFQE